MALDPNSRQQLGEIKSHEHNMIIYEDLEALREIYCGYSKDALEKNNEIVLIATAYETPRTVRSLLRDYGVNVSKYEKEHSLAIIDSMAGYQLADVYGVFKLIKSMVTRGQKEGKSDVLNISDMGSFFILGREKDLITYELSLPKQLELPVKGLCCYHKKDFDGKLSRKEQLDLTNHHARSIVATTFKANRKPTVFSNEAA